MKLRFESDLPHQRAAIDAVLRSVEPGSVREAGMRIDAQGLVAHANPIGLPARVAVEMETGTGKTYVFLRTALELAALHGVRKFIIVVPSVAIREGVMATLRGTREHFARLFPRLSPRFFAYQRDRLGRLRQFVRATTVEFMVVTIDAFTKDTNVLRRPCDAFGGQSPLAAVAATRAVVIVDEPHRMQTGLRAGALADLCPGMVLGYGATLGRWEGPVVHRLTPAEAHRLGLVKSIIVRAAGGGDGYASQIRSTIAAHLERAAALRPLGIKVLSLFFLDRVSAYAEEDGLARNLFDQHFDELKHAVPEFAALPASAVRSGYFATRAGRAVDTKTGRAVADAEAYELILRDKPRLLSFDEPVSFVFSHSALREGWDNPNVFQICTLGRSDSAVRKRQEIGRGIRLCVDQDGRRVPEASINVLEVFANESYEAFVAGLQDDDVWTASESAPLPRRSGDPRVSQPEAAEPWPGDDQLVQRAGASLQGFEAVPTRNASVSVVEHALGQLARRGAPLRRATVLAALEASGCGDALASDPLRGGRAVAEALCRAQQSSSS
ncbi:MAG: DEAD/DEAH box helicase family protein [Nannocystales bacterium]